MQELILNTLLTIWAITFSIGLISFYSWHSKAAHNVSMIFGIVTFIWMPIIILLALLMFNIWG